MFPVPFFWFFGRSVGSVTMETVRLTRVDNSTQDETEPTHGWCAMLFSFSWLDTDGYPRACCDHKSCRVCAQSVRCHIPWYASCLACSVLQTIPQPTRWTRTLQATCQATTQEKTWLGTTLARKSFLTVNRHVVCELTFVSSLDHCRVLVLHRGITETSSMFFPHSSSGHRLQWRLVEDIACPRSSSYLPSKSCAPAWRSNGPPTSSLPAAMGREQQSVGGRLGNHNAAPHCYKESDWAKCVRLCRQIQLTRDFFSNTLTLCTHRIVAQGVAACVWQNHSCTCHQLFERSLSVLVLSLLLSLSRLYFLSLTVYLFSVLLINFHVVGTAED